MTRVIDRLSDGFFTLLRQVITPDTITLGFVIGVLVSFLGGFWYRISKPAALTGWELLTGNGSPDIWSGMILSNQLRFLLIVIPLMGLFASLLALTGIIQPAQRKRSVTLIALCGLINLGICLVYVLALLASPVYNRVLDFGFWLTLIASTGMVVQHFFNRPGMTLPLKTHFRVMAMITLLLAALFFVTLITQIVRSRENESVAFEITSLIGMALYGGSIGYYLTGNIFRRKGQNPQLGRLLGTLVGAFGHLALLIPLWVYTPNRQGVEAKRIKLDEIAWGMVLLAPWLISFILLNIFPMLDSYRVALYNWHGFGEPSQFVGLRHIQNVIKDPIFWQSLGNTVTYTVILVPIQLSLALTLAIILTRQRMRFAVLYRTIYFLPAVTSIAVVAVIMRLILGNFGTNISAFFGITPPVSPISDPQLALPSVIIFGIWHSFGVNLVYFLAALQTVPQELYDAAQVDGANWFDELFHITLPSIRPISIIIVFMAFIGSMYVFEQSFVLTRGGPYFASQVVTGYIYNYAFRQPGTQLTPNFGYASAAALFFAMIMLVLTVTNYVVTTRMRKNQ